MDEIFEPIMGAIRAGELAQVEALLKASPGLATAESETNHPTLLQLVVVEGGLGDLPDAEGAARILIEAGAPLDYPLVAAAGVGAWALVKQLLAAGAPVDACAPWTPLEEALYWGKLELAARLMGRGARVGSLRAAAGLGDLERVQGWFEDSGRLRAGAGPVRWPFHHEIPGRPDAPQAIRDTAFVQAMMNGHLAVAGFLLGCGAEISCLPLGFHWSGTALHGAIMNGNDEAVEWLLARGADPHVKDLIHNDTACGWARHHGRDALADRLEAIVIEP